MEQCVAILAPSGRDAEVLAGILKSADIDCTIHITFDEFADSLAMGRTGALVVAEEAFTPTSLAAIEAWLNQQPPWSDLPIMLLTFRRDISALQSRLAERLGNVTILERPLHPVTLVSSARAALRARARQREAETHVAELAQERSALQASEERYRTLFESIDEGFCVIEFLDGPHGPLSDYVHVEANPAYTANAGIPNIVGKHLREIVSTEQANGWAAIYRRVLMTGEPVRFERELVETGRDLELAAFRVEPAERRQVAVLFKDVTARKRAEAQLRELNETLERRVSETLAERKLLADIVEGTDAFVQVTDTEFRWLAINRAAKDEFERIFGVRPKTGDSMLEVLAHLPEHRDAVQKIWKRALAGEEFTEIAEFGDPSRDQRFYEMKFNVLRDARGRQIGAYQFVYDVTERLHAEGRLEQATARVHEMAKLETLGQLTGGVAHDFNNLLTPIVGALDMLHRRQENDERSTRLISGALQGAERAALLVQRLLTFARRQHLETRAVNVGNLVEGMRDLIQRSIGPHIPVHMTLPPRVAAARIDPNQLELAVLNLAVNARDAMAGGGELTIEVGEANVDSDAERGLELGRYVRLSVSDTGTGMDEATLKRAVEPFFTTKGQGKGTGLGLSMVHGLAAQSGGTLKLKSRPGHGTTAELWLPVTDDPVDQMNSDGAGPLLLQPKQATILLVDDEDLVRAATAEMLRDMGHRVIEVTSASAALAKIRSKVEVDVLVTDYLMPQMRGAALIREAQRLRPSLPALLVTGYANLSEQETPDLPRLAKPFKEVDLAREIAQLLSRERVIASAGQPRKRSSSAAE